MSLLICPDCGNEVSTAAVACPKCGRPTAPPVFEERTVIREAVPAVVERESFPKWIFIPLGLLGVILIFLMIMLFSQEKDEQTNVSVNLSNRRSANSSNINTTRAEIETNQVVIPPSSADPMISNVAPLPSNSGTTVTEIPGNAEKVDRGSVNLEAKVSDTSGSPRPVRAEKFYLLDKDLNSILSDADIEPISSQTLQNSFGISVVYPDRYAEIRNKSLAEIKKHIKYEVTTDSSGKAQMKDVKPDGYYLFAITKTSTGFAIWSSPVQVNAGQNNLNLSPPPTVETPEEE